VKFQKRTNRELLSEEEYNKPHPVPENSYGCTYGEHREFLEFSISRHEELKHCAHENKIGYGCSVWDVTSTVEVASINPDFIKIPSAMNLCYSIYEALNESGYSGQVQVSLGMTTYQEFQKVLDYLRSFGMLDRTVLYHCTSAYPAPFDSLCLYQIRQLKEEFPRLQIGYSGHHIGISVDVATIALGATWIERHFTLNKDWKGTDHKASLEPDELRALVQSVYETSKALSFKSGILECEEFQRRKLKKIILPGKRATDKKEADVCQQNRTV
jgi:N-acetylneuraminate synthase